jgi:hypothetical protein
MNDPHFNHHAARAIVDDEAWADAEADDLKARVILYGAGLFALLFVAPLLALVSGHALIVGGFICAGVFAGWVMIRAISGDER